jgi:sirohydrochlorin ferrochelatase
MNTLKWVLLILCAFASGVCLMRYLVADPQVMSLYIVLLLASIGLLVWIAWSTLTGWQVLWGVLLAIVFFGAGYLVSTRLYLNQSEERVLPEITRSPEEPGDGHVAVLYYTHGEPQAYSPWPWLETFHELDKDRATFIPWPFRPFFFYNLRRYYLELGGSAHVKVHQIMLHSLIQSIPEEKRQNIRFYQAFLDNPPRPDEMAIQAINEGASKLVVLPVFLTKSSHTLAGEEQINSLGLDQFNLEVCFGEPLWETTALQQMFVERSNRHLFGTPKEKTGILLVGHGQPDDWDRLYPTQTEQENVFREKVRERLIQDGYLPENVVLAWMEFKEPAVTEGMEALLDQDVELILVYSASISADSIHSDIQVPEEVHKANIPDDVKVVNMGPWGNSPLVIEAIRQRLLECTPELDQ